MKTLDVTPGRSMLLFSGHSPKSSSSGPDLCFCMFVAHNGRNPIRVVFTKLIVQWGNIENKPPHSRHMFPFKVSFPSKASKVSLQSVTHFSLAHYIVTSALPSQTVFWSWRVQLLAYRSESEADMICTGLIGHPITVAGQEELQCKDEKPVERIAQDSSDEDLEFYKKGMKDASKNKKAAQRKNNRDRDNVDNAVESDVDSDDPFAKLRASFRASRATQRKTEAKAKVKLLNSMFEAGNVAKELEQKKRAASQPGSASSSAGPPQNAASSSASESASSVIRPALNIVPTQHGHIAVYVGTVAVGKITSWSDSKTGIMKFCCKCQLHGCLHMFSAMAFPGQEVLAEWLAAGVGLTAAQHRGLPKPCKRV